MNARISIEIQDRMKFLANHKETDKYTMIFKKKDRKRMTEWVSEWVSDREKKLSKKEERRET